MYESTVQLFTKRVMMTVKIRWKSKMSSQMALVCHFMLREERSGINLETDEYKAVNGIEGKYTLILYLVECAL